MAVLKETELELIYREPNNKQDYLPSEGGRDLLWRAKGRTRRVTCHKEQKQSVRIPFMCRAPEIFCRVDYCSHTFNCSVSTQTSHQRYKEWLYRIIHSVSIRIRSQYLSRSFLNINYMDFFFLHSIIPVLIFFHESSVATMGLLAGGGPPLLSPGGASPIGACCCCCNKG